MNNIHQSQPVLSTGATLGQAKAAVIMVHGRGASAEDILSLIPAIDQPGFAYLAPQAANSTWYPYSFLSPLEMNEPYLTSALATLGALLKAINDAGVPSEKVILLGFSQGACLSSEFAARNARRYGGIVGLSGGLIGPEDSPRDYAGSFHDTPIFLGCSDVDPHIPAVRVQHSAEVMQRMGAQVRARLYPNMAHTVNEDELEFVRLMMSELVI